MGITYEQAVEGTPVVFGRKRGEQTLGKIAGYVRGNRTKVKVKIFENRGTRSVAGEVWTVGLSLIRLATKAEVEQMAAKPEPAEPERPGRATGKLEYNMFQPAEEVHILMAILACYSGLSPENLTADGEAPRHFVRQQSARLNRMLRGLFAAYGRVVDELEVNDWYAAKEADEKQRAAQRASA